MAKFVILRSIRYNSFIICPHADGEDYTRGANNEVWFKIEGYADSMEEAKGKVEDLKYGTHPEDKSFFTEDDFWLALIRNGLVSRRALAGGGTEFDGGVTHDAVIKAYEELRKLCKV